MGWDPGAGVGDRDGGCAFAARLHHLRRQARKRTVGRGPVGRKSLPGGRLRGWDGMCEMRGRLGGAYVDRWIGREICVEVVGK